MTAIDLEIPDNEKRAIRLFLSRFDPKTRPNIQNLISLYGISSLLHIDSLTKLSSPYQIETLTQSARKFATHALGTEPHGKHYWNGKPDGPNGVSKGPGPARSKGNGRKDVMLKYPFADSKASVSRIVRQDLKTPAYSNNVPPNTATNELGVRPFLMLSSRGKDKAVSSAYKEFNFNVRGVNRRDVREALKYIGASGGGGGGSVGDYVKSVEAGNMEYFNLGNWEKLVGEVNRISVEDTRYENMEVRRRREVERDNYIEESIHPEDDHDNGNHDYDEEDTSSEPPPLKQSLQNSKSKTKPTTLNRNQISHGNIIPWNGEGTTRSALGEVKYDKNLRARTSSSSSSSSSTSSYAGSDYNTTTQKRPKSASERWSIARENAKQKAANVQKSKSQNIPISVPAENRKGYYGRTQYGGGDRYVASSRRGDDERREELRKAIARGRRELLVNGNGDGIDDSYGMREPRAESVSTQTPVRKQKQANLRNGIGEAVDAAERFLNGELAKEMGVEESEVDNTNANSTNTNTGSYTGTSTSSPSTDSITDDSFNANLDKSSKKGGGSEEPNVAGWIGDFIGNTFHLTNNDGTKNKEEEEPSTSNPSTSGSSLNLTNLNSSKSSSGTGTTSTSNTQTNTNTNTSSSNVSSTLLSISESRIAGSGSRSGSSVASNEIYRATSASGSGSGSNNSSPESVKVGSLESLSPESDL